MSRLTSSSGVAGVSAPLRRGVAPGAEVASGDGQLRHARRAARASVAEEASSFCVPLCADQFKLVESGGALVSRIDRESDSARQFRECAGSKAGDRGIYASLERKPQAVHLERHCRRDHQKDRSRAGEDGADQARIHPARGQREGAYAVRLYTGHTTSLGNFSKVQGILGMRNLNESGKALRELLSQRILVLDGAMGTMLQQRGLAAADFGGPELEGCNENLVRTRPDVVLDIHRKYLQAGADIIETNSFNGTKSDLIDYGVADQSYELMSKAAHLARQAADEFSTPSKPRFVAGSMGPTRKAITVTGGITFDHLRQDYYDLAKPLIDGGADLLIVETCQDTRNIKAALLSIRKLSRELAAEIPFIISVTIEQNGSMLAGQTIDAMWASLKYAK